MRIGSIVECIHDFESDPLRHLVDIVPKKGHTYTVKGFYELFQQVFVFLEEIKTTKLSDNTEVGTAIRCYREVEFPDDLETEIKEALTRPERTRILVHEYVGDDKFKKYTRWK